MLEFFTNYGPDILEVVAYLIAAASLIVKITPNKTDNKILQKIVKLVELIGLNTEPVKDKD